MKFIILFICCILSDIGKSENVKWKRIIKSSIRNPEPLSDEIINYINNYANTTWEAGPTSRFKNIIEAKNVLGVIKSSDELKLPYKEISHNSISLPTTFDSRIKWSHCKYINEIRDQSDCGSCWIFGAVEAMTDRHCIHSNGALQIRLSAEDPLECCNGGNGCNGGNPSKVWEYWNTDGIVTGGPYGSHQGCLDYSISPKHGFFEKFIENYFLRSAQSCVKKCQAGYYRTFQRDKNYGKSSYSIHLFEEEIMREIFENGPVEASFVVYSDFFNYKNGVYQHEIGKFEGRHAVKMLGWGIENNTPYWLMANSWGTKWGNNGFFKIRRGVNECSIEEDIVAGMPR